VLLTITKLARARNGEGRHVQATRFPDVTSCCVTPEPQFLVSVSLCSAASLDHSSAVVETHLPLHHRSVLVLVRCSDAMQQINLPYWMLSHTKTASRRRIGSKEFRKKCGFCTHRVSPVQWTWICRDWQCMNVRNA
jgi:hypothetical protein